MQRFTRHMTLGFRWLRCGWRLFMRNPWRLGPMGFFAAVLVGGLTLIPLAGALLVAFLTPMLLASACLAIDAVSRQKIALPATLRRAAVEQSPREFLQIFRDEERLMPAVIAGLYCMAVSLLIGLLVQVAAGDAWVSRWNSLEPGARVGVFAASLFMLALYFGLIASLAYALPLAFLQNEPLFPALARSFKTGVHYVAGLAVVLLPLLFGPILLGGIASPVSFWGARLLWIIAGTIVLPLVATSLYCSYRSLFPLRDTSPQAVTSPGTQGNFS